MDNKGKFEVVLSLFGSAQARSTFIELCEKYAALRSVAAPDEHGENYTSRTYSAPKRANFHNQIMSTLQRLSLQKLTPLQERVLHEMASREVTGQIIKDWVAAHESFEEDDEIERAKKETDMSGPAYFHSLGREH